MAKRIKVAEPTLATRAEAEDALGEIRDLTLERQRIALAIEVRKKAIDDQYAARLGDIDRAVLAKSEQLKVWAQANPADFGGKKSLAMTHGTIGFRLGNPTLKPLSKWSFVKVLEALQKAGLVDFIRKKEEVDKEALLARAKDKKNPFPFGEYGLRVSQEEPFFVDPKIESPEPIVTTETAVAA